MTSLKLKIANLAFGFKVQKEFGCVSMGVGEGQMEERIFDGLTNIYLKLPLFCTESLTLNCKTRCN